MRNDPSKPYNDLPRLPPEAEVETLATLKAVIGANRALAELKAAGNLIPNQALLVRAVLLQEAKVSSEIENIVTTNDELYRAFTEDPERTDPPTKEVLRYEHALWTGFNRIREGQGLQADAFEKLVQVIKDPSYGIRERPGTRIMNRTTGKPVYTPPEGKARIAGLLENLSDYMNSEDGTDPLIKMAVAHYQFEAIHPFHDGNGRTGRIVNILFLVHAGVLDLPILYLSHYIIQNKPAYYRGLRGVTEEGRWEEWITFMLRAIEVTALDTRRRIVAIRDALAAAVVFASENMTRGYRKELIELVFQQPYTRIRFLEEAGLAKRDAASANLRELERIGILRSIKRGREVLYVNELLLEILGKE